MAARTATTSTGEALGGAGSPFATGTPLTSCPGGPGDRADRAGRQRRTGGERRAGTTQCLTGRRHRHPGRHAGSDRRPDRRGGGPAAHDRRAGPRQARIGTRPPVRLSGRRALMPPRYRRPVTAAEKARRSQVSADKLTALHGQLAEQVAALRTGEDWRRWLEVAGRFHRYSFNNTLLIAGQRPDATAVAGYEAWKAMGRQVTKGEKGLRILAPIVRRAGAGAGQDQAASTAAAPASGPVAGAAAGAAPSGAASGTKSCLLYTSDAADEED